MSVKQTVIRTATGSLAAILVFIVLLLHNAWGDDRYVLKEENRLERIAFIDTQLLINDQETIFAESAVVKEKLRAIKAIYQRQKEALKESSKD